MNPKTKLVVWILAGLIALALVEQLTPAHCYYSRLTEWTHVEDRASAHPGDLVYTLREEKPFTRWLPFVKFGETVFFHTYWHADGAKGVQQRDATTTVHLLVIGLCSTAKYDQLARAPFEQVHKEYLKR